MAAGEPEYVDQVPRKLAFEAAHPEVTITWLGPYWKAVTPAGAVTAVELEHLLDRLESM